MAEYYNGVAILFNMTNQDTNYGNDYEYVCWPDSENSVNNYDDDATIINKLRIGDLDIKNLDFSGEVITLYEESIKPYIVKDGNFKYGDFYIQVLNRNFNDESVFYTLKQEKITDVLVNYYLDATSNTYDGNYDQINWLIRDYDPTFTCSCDGSFDFILRSIPILVASDDFKDQVIITTSADRAYREARPNEKATHIFDGNTYEPSENEATHVLDNVEFEYREITEGETGTHVLVNAETGEYSTDSAEEATHILYKCKINVSITYEEETYSFTLVNNYDTNTINIENHDDEVIRFIKNEDTNILMLSGKRIYVDNFVKLLFTENTSYSVPYSDYDDYKENSSNSGNTPNKKIINTSKYENLIVSLNNQNKEGKVTTTNGLFHFHLFCDSWNKYHEFIPADKVSILKKGLYSFKCYDGKQEVPGNVNIMTLDGQCKLLNSNRLVGTGQLINLNDFNEDYTLYESWRSKLNKVDLIKLKIEILNSNLNEWTNLKNWLLWENESDLSNKPNLIPIPLDIDQEIINLYNKVTDELLIGSTNIRNYNKDWMLLIDTKEPEDAEDTSNWKPVDKFISLTTGDYVDVNLVTFYLEYEGRIDGGTAVVDNRLYHIEMGVTREDDYTFVIWYTCLNGGTESMFVAEISIQESDRNGFKKYNCDCVCMSSLGTTETHNVDCDITYHDNSIDLIMSNIFVDINATPINPTHEPEYNIIYDLDDLNDNDNYVDAKFMFKRDDFTGALSDGRSYWFNGILYSISVENKDDTTEKTFVVSAEINDESINYVFTVDVDPNEDELLNITIDCPLIGTYKSDAKVYNFVKSTGYINEYYTTIQIALKLPKTISKLFPYDYSLIKLLPIKLDKVDSGYQSHVTIKNYMFIVKYSSGILSIEYNNKQLCRIRINLTKNNLEYYNSECYCIVNPYDYTCVYKSKISYVTINSSTIEITILDLIIPIGGLVDAEKESNLGIKLNLILDSNDLGYKLEYSKYKELNLYVGADVDNEHNVSVKVGLTDDKTKADTFNFKYNNSLIIYAEEPKFKPSIVIHESDKNLKLEIKYFYINCIIDDVMSTKYKLIDNKKIWLTESENIFKTDNDYCIDLISNLISTSITADLSNLNIEFKKNLESPSLVVLNRNEGNFTIFSKTGFTETINITSVSSDYEFIYPCLVTAVVDPENDSGLYFIFSNLFIETLENLIYVDYVNTVSINKTTFLEYITTAVQHIINNLKIQISSTVDGENYIKIKKLEENIDLNKDWLGRIQFIPDNPKYLKAENYNLNLSIIFKENLDDFNNINYYNSKNEYVSCSYVKNCYLGSKDYNLKTVMDEGILFTFKADYKSPYYVKGKYKKIQSKELFPIICNVIGGSDNYVNSLVPLDNYNYNTNKHFKYVAGVCHQDKGGKKTQIFTTLYQYDPSRDKYVLVDVTEWKADKERNVDISEQNAFETKVIEVPDIVFLTPTFLYKTGKDKLAKSSVDANGYTVAVKEKPDMFESMPTSLGYIEGNKIYPGSLWNREVSEWEGLYLGLLTNLYFAYSRTTDAPYNINYAGYKKYETSFTKDILVSVSPRSLNDCNKYFTIRDADYVSWLTELLKYRTGTPNNDFNINLQLEGVIKNFPMTFNFEYKLPVIDMSDPVEDDSVVHSIYGDSRTTLKNLDANTIYTLDENKNPVNVLSYPYIPRCHRNDFVFDANSTLGIKYKGRPTLTVCILDLVNRNLRKNNNYIIMDAHGDLGTYDILTTQRRNWIGVKKDEYLTGLPKNAEFIE